MKECDFPQCKAADRQLLVDVSTLIHVDDGSGIQRVVRNILKCFQQSPPSGVRVRPVYRKGGGYRYAEKFSAGGSSQDRGVEGSPVRVINRGDVFLGLDLDHKIDTGAQRFLQRQQREHGLLVYFVVYDLLAVTHPEWFNRHLSAVFRKWLKRVVAVADGLVCISKSVAEELTVYLADHKSAKDVEVGFFHLGADISPQEHEGCLSVEEDLIMQWLKEHTVFLMVGTLEPRKGHVQVLDAMTELWKDGEDVLLVIAGKKGWKVEELVKSINHHPENGEHLFWFENVSDAFLLQLYNHCSALIMASEGEGFGLPLIEAARHQLPLIARDLSVFREVAADHAFYFTGSGGRDLQLALSDWLVLYHEDKHPVSTNLEWQAWAQSSSQLLDAVLKQE